MANPITYHDMTPAIGATVTVKFESIQVNCIVRNVKNSYGRVRLEVAPLNGSGSQWIETSRLSAFDRDYTGELRHGTFEISG